MHVLMLFTLNRLFVNDAKEDVTNMEQQLIADGMSEKQVNAVAYAVANIRTNVASCIWNTIILFVALNGVLFRIAMKKQAAEILSLQI